MARHLNPASLRPAQTTTIQCGEMGRTTLGLSSKSVNHVAGLKCQRCHRPGTGVRRLRVEVLEPRCFALQREPPCGATILPAVADFALLTKKARTPQRARAERLRPEGYLPASHLDLGGRQVAGHVVLGHLIHDDLIGLHVAGHVNLHWLVDGLVFLFYVPVTSLKLGEAPPRAARKWSRPDSYADSCSVGRPRRVRCRTDYRETVRITRTQIRWQPRKTCNSKRFETFSGLARRVPPCICRPPGESVRPRRPRN